MHTSPQEIAVHERGMIGAMLFDPSIINEVAGSLDPEMFADLELRKFFLCILNTHTAGMNVNDRNALGAALVAAGVPEELCTVASLHKLRNTAFPDNRRWHIDVIRNAWKSRRLMELGREAARRGEGSAEPDKDVAWLESQLDILTTGGSGLQTRRAEFIADDVLAEIEAAASAESKPGVMSGIYSLDAALGPIMPGELGIIAARPGGGKTALAMQIAQHAATRGPVLFVSLEMRDRELIQRSLSSISGVDSRLIREARVSKESFHLLRTARSALTGLQLDICAPPRATISQIVGLAKYHKAVHGLRMMFVDYVGLILPAREDRRQERHIQVGGFTAALKAVAKECGCPVVTLAQLNRDAQNREPTLANLRESGSIEQDADIVLMIHHQPTEGDVHLRIEKHRHGRAMRVRMRWNAATTSFHDIEGEHEWKGG